MKRRLDTQRIYNRLGYLQRDVLYGVIDAEERDATPPSLRALSGRGGLSRLRKAALRLVARGLLKRWWVVEPCTCCPLYLTVDGRAVAELVAMYERECPQ